VGTGLECGGPLGGTGDRTDHPRTQVARQLHGRMPHAAGGPKHQHGLAGLQTATFAQGIQRRAIGHAQHCSFFDRGLGSYEVYRVDRYAQPLGPRADGRGATHPIADGEGPLHPIAQGINHAGELTADNEGQRGAPLVATPRDQHVEERHAAGPHLHAYLTWARRGVRQGVQAQAFSEVMNTKPLHAST
jgi:hypothetical protein